MESDHGEHLLSERRLVMGHCPRAHQRSRDRCEMCDGGGSTSFAIGFSGELALALLQSAEEAIVMVVAVGCRWHCGSGRSGGKPTQWRL